MNKTRVLYNDWSSFITFEQAISTKEFRHEVAQNWHLLSVGRAEVISLQ